MVRIIEIERPKATHLYKKEGPYMEGIYAPSQTGYLGVHGGLPTTETLGWRPSCSCNVPTNPDTVLDPFCGSGTTGQVAKKFGRKAVLIDISLDYCELAKRRIESVALPMVMF